MKPQRLCVLVAGVAVLLLGASLPVFAQVDKAAMRTSGISCGECAAIAEIYLRRLDGVGAVTIHKAQEIVMITYKPGASFNPFDIRDALDRTDVSVVQFQISARGRVQEQKGKRIFVAGKDKFVLVASPDVKVPSDTPISIVGNVNDRPDPMELKILTVTPLAAK